MITRHLLIALAAAGGLALAACETDSSYTPTTVHPAAAPSPGDNNATGLSRQSATTNGHVGRTGDAGAELPAQ
jgi:hypothetical protein